LNSDRDGNLRGLKRRNARVESGQLGDPRA